MLKKCLLALTLAGLTYVVTPAAMAQDAPSSDQQSAPAGAPPERKHGSGHFDPERRSEMLNKHLNLNADQQAKVQEILKSEHSQMQTIHSDSALAQSDRRSKMMDVHKSSNDQIRALLDADQQKKWDTMQSKHEHWMKKRQHGEPAPAPDSSEQK
jgi:hypothetical protein